mgnify:FL=1
MIVNKIAIVPCSNLTHKVNVLVIDYEPLEEPPKETTEKSQDEVYISSNQDNKYTINVARSIDPNDITFEINRDLYNPNITFGAYVNHENIR